MTKEELLEKISKNDTFGLLKPKANHRGRSSTTQHQRLINSFQEISDFFEEQGRLPKEDGNVAEMLLYSRLKAIKSDPAKVRILLDYDFYNLLDAESTKSISKAETLEDPLGLLDLSDEDDSIYKLQHVEKSERIRPDYVAHRRICPDFDEFVPLFKNVTDDLKAGRRKLIQFSEHDLNSKSLFVLNGVMMILIDVDTKVSNYNFNSGNRVREDGRTRCIFDNGTESKMLYRSLGKALLKNGFSISDPIIKSRLTDDGSNIEKSDISNGYIYVLKSRSNDSKITAFKHLYKIGYCTTTISERTADAKNDPTYLMADVQLMLSVKCFNLNLQKLEDDIHKFFDRVNIEFRIQGNDGQIHYPKEWFDVPLSIIQEAIPLIVEGKSKNYYYDPDAKLIIKKSN